MQQYLRDSAVAGSCATETVSDNISGTSSTAIENDAVVPDVSDAKAHEPDTLVDPAPDSIDHSDSACSVYVQPVSIQSSSTQPAYSDTPGDGAAASHYNRVDYTCMAELLSEEDSVEPVSGVAMQAKPHTDKSMLNSTQLERGRQRHLHAEDPQTPAWSRVRRLDRVHTAHSNQSNPELAALEVAQGLSPQDVACVVFFCSPQYELSALGRALVQRFPGVTLIGCTTAGEISQRGLTSNSITAFSLPKSHFAVDALLIEDLRASGSESLESALSEKLQLLSTRAVAMSPRQTFAFALLDGMSVQEEVILSSIARSLGSVPLIGGSAGDGLKYDDTFVFSDGRFHNHAGVVLLVNTRCRFEVLSGHHFEASTEKMVVTRADPTNRTVYEINAEPAAPEYCRIMGLTLDDLKEGAFAKHPVGVQVGENLYVRSIRQLNDDLSLTFFCAIDSGVVLTRLLDQGLLDHFSRMVDLAKQNIGDVQLIVGCDCIHRLVEAEQKGLAQDLSVLYQKHRVLGFNTYGEQFGGLHLNHTFTGLAIGTPAY